MVYNSTLIAWWLPIWTWTSMPEYNCSRIRPVGEEWTAAVGVKHPLYGIWSLAWGIVTELSYIPCIYALWMERRHACYRIMLWLAIDDVIALTSNSISFGLVLLEGSVFCSRPWIFWIVGCLGATTNYLIVAATCYAAYIALFTPPVIPNSTHKAMFFDPFLGDVPGDVYVNWPSITNNYLVVLTSATLYILLVIVVMTKRGAMKSAAGRSRMSASYPIFVQASLICFCNVTASMEYSYMTFFPTPPILVDLGHISWQLTHGMPPFIYLLFNKTVQRHCRRLIFGPEKKVVKDFSLSTVPTEVVMMDN